VVKRNPARDAIFIERKIADLFSGAEKAREKMVI
jgi:hypothetical protein